MLVFYTWTVRNAADAISLMSSTEKIGWLATKTPQEGGPVAVVGRSNADGDHDGLNAEDAETQHAHHKLAVVTTNTPGANWPARGIINFDNVWMKYAPTAPFALKGVTFSLGHGEKAGVVGRTGSGKSTLLLALYRMFDLEKGHIVIDGVDVATLTLKKLRMGLSIIPQEPVVFSGTVRSNLDPFSEFQDARLWEVIKKVGLEDQVGNCGGLDGKVDGTGGQAWSLGQQQLVCLCRAQLRAVPILCLDEATAAMDPHTEQQVQAVMKRIFTDRTTLTIAHRLDTVIESHYVLVMEAGVLKEMAPPKTLLDDRESMFSKLVDKTGP
jgi:ABC-type multidrug transport system fused ATPase/permease subunit